jgi:hypothetical protein
LAYSRIEALAAGGLLVLLAVGGAFEFNLRKLQPHIAVEKVLDPAGGMYSIQGSGYEPNEMISLEIKNAPLTQPSGWHLGSTSAVKGKFSFKTEDFRCVRIDNPQLREQYKRKRVIFVATGLRSGQAATAVDTASGIFMCL